MMSAYGRSHSSVHKTHIGDAVGLIGVPDAPFSLSTQHPLLVVHNREHETRTHFSRSLHCSGISDWPAYRAAVA